MSDCARATVQTGLRFGRLLDQVCWSPTCWGGEIKGKGGGGEEGGQSSEGEDEVKGIMEKQKGLKGQSNERNVKMLQCRDGDKYEVGGGKKDKDKHMEEEEVNMTEQILEMTEEEMLRKTN